MHAGDDLHQRRFAGAVFADEAVDFARTEREIDIAQRVNAAEGLRDAAHLEKRRASRCFRGHFAERGHFRQPAFRRYAGK
jgi:hypothetical protein